MGAVTIALVGFFAFLIMRVTTPQMTPLFTDLSLEDSAAIAKELDREGVTYELRNDGNIIMVPGDRVARLRMTLAENGLPKGGGVGYEIFDKSDALGTTSFVQNINNLRALEGELARTIRALDRVQAARVHLVMPERPLFSRDKIDPSASIVLKVRGTLEAAQVRAIRHLVATAVNGLSPQRISIVDEQGQLLADGATDDDDRQRRQRRRAAGGLRKTSAPAGGIDRLVGGRPRPFARAGQRRFRLQPHHPDLGQIRSRRPRHPLEPDPRGDLGIGRRQPASDGRQRIARRQSKAAGRRRCRTARPEPEVGRNRQLRDFENHQDRSDRRRPRQPPLGRGPGRRHLRQGRQGRRHLSAAQQGGSRSDRDAGALGDRLQPEARRPGRGRQSALCRDAGDDRSPSRPAGSTRCSSPKTTSCAPSKWW